MVCRAALVVLAFAPVAAARPPRPAAEPEWETVGLSVVKPDPDDEFKARLLDPAGTTTLVAQLQLPGHVILGVDPTQSNLDRFTDNRSTNLLLPPAQAKVARVTAAAAPVHGKTVRVTFHGTGCPAAGATRLRLAGQVGVLVGKGEKTAERKDVAVRTGVELAGGTLKALADAFATKANPTALKYTGTRPLERLAFVDATGEEVELRRNPFTANRTVVGAKGEFTALYSWPRTAPDPCTFRATYYDRVELVVVPVELEAGLGLR